MTPLRDADYRALAEFRRALRVFLHFSEDAARSEGVTPNQHQLLLAIRGRTEGEPPTVSDVAAQLHLQHNSVVELVDRAAKAGLVRRDVDRLDRRRQRLSLTTRGEKKLEALSAAHRDELRRFRDEMAEVLKELD